MGKVRHTMADVQPMIGPPPPIPNGITYWYGDATGSWWAIVPRREGPALLEAPSVNVLAVRVDWHLRSVAR